MLILGSDTFTSARVNPPRTVENPGECAQQVHERPQPLVKSGAGGDPLNSMLRIAEISRYKTLMTTFHNRKSPNGHPVSMQIYVIFALANTIHFCHHRLSPRKSSQTSFLAPFSSVFISCKKWSVYVHLLYDGSLEGPKINIEIYLFHITNGIPFYNTAFYSILFI